MDFNSDIMKRKFPSGSTFRFGSIGLQTDQFGALSYTKSSSSNFDKEVCRFEPDEKTSGLSRTSQVFIPVYSSQSVVNPSQMASSFTRGYIE
uniref:Uncharacterized protein n=1 Tax=Oryza brachyantha TaxID=4533 RepID=J3N7N1_ORYBR